MEWWAFAQALTSGSSDAEVVELKAAVDRLTSEVCELKGALATVLAAQKPIAEDSNLPDIEYDRVQFIPLLIKSSTCKDGDRARYRKETLFTMVSLLLWYQC